MFSLNASSFGKIFPAIFPKRLWWARDWGGVLRGEACELSGSGLLANRMASQDEGSVFRPRGDEVKKSSSLLLQAFCFRPRGDEVFCCCLNVVFPFLWAPKMSDNVYYVNSDLKKADSRIPGRDACIAFSIRPSGGCLVDAFASSVLVLSDVFSDSPSAPCASSQAVLPSPVFEPCFIQTTHQNILAPKMRVLRNHAVR